MLTNAGKPGSCLAFLLFVSAAAIGGVITLAVRLRKI
jgi:hypothetical protein